MNKQIEQLFKRHYRKMYLLAKVLLRDGDAAKDAVSDVFADMLDNNATVDSETAESFLLVCVRNKCLNLSLIHISEPTRQDRPSRMPSSA